MIKPKDDYDFVYFNAFFISCFANYKRMILLFMTNLSPKKTIIRENNDLRHVIHVNVDLKYWLKTLLKVYEFLRFLHQGGLNREWSNK